MKNCYKTPQNGQNLLSYSEKVIKSSKKFSNEVTKLMQKMQQVSKHKHVQQVSKTLRSYMEYVSSYCVLLNKCTSAYISKLVH